MAIFCWPGSKVLKPNDPSKLDNIDTINKPLRCVILKHEILHRPVPYIVKNLIRSKVIYGHLGFYTNASLPLQWYHYHKGLNL